MSARISSSTKKPVIHSVYCANGIIFRPVYVRFSCSKLLSRRTKKSLFYRNKLIESVLP